MIAWEDSRKISPVICKQEGDRGSEVRFRIFLHESACKTEWVDVTGIDDQCMI